MHTPLDTLTAPYAALLAPLSDSACGPDLEYDPHYLELFIKLIPKEKKVVGGEAGSEKLESELEPLRWTEIEQDCLSLMQRTRDARLAAVFTRCRVQQDGWQGLLEGLALTLALLRGFPEDLHPALTLDGQRDVLPRADALSALADQEGLLSDIRALPMDDTGRLRVCLRDVERALTRPHPDNMLPPDAARRMLADMRQRGASHCLALLDALELTTAIAAEASQPLDDDERNVMSEALRLRPLLDMLHTVAASTQGGEQESPTRPGSTGAAGPASSTGSGGEAGAAADADPAHASAQYGTAPATPSSQPVSHGPAPIRHRNEARERIREARFWFEEHEPSSPVSLLLRKAEHLVGKRFAQVVETLPLELLEKWEQEE